MNETLDIANGPIPWILALITIGLVVAQTFMFVAMARKYIKDTGVLTKAEVGKAIKVGTIGTIGPAIAVFTVAVVLIGLIGGPITLSRVGVIGSAAFESLTAAEGSGRTLGTDGFTPTLLATAAWVMAFGGSGWLISTLILTKPLDVAQERFKQSNPAMIGLIGAMAPFMVFFVMGYTESMNKIRGNPAEGIPGSYGTLVAVIVGALAMWGFIKLAHISPKWAWMGEWAMGFAIILAIFAGVAVDAGMGN